MTLYVFHRKHSRKWLRMLASSVSSILTWPEESLPFIQDSSSECLPHIHNEYRFLSKNELWQERVLFYKVRTVKSEHLCNRHWVLGNSAWKVLCSVGIWKHISPFEVKMEEIKMFFKVLWVWVICLSEILKMLKADEMWALFICSSWTMCLVFGHWEAYADLIKQKQIKYVLFHPIIKCKLSNEHSQGITQHYMNDVRVLAVVSIWSTDFFISGIGPWHEEHPCDVWCLVKMKQSIVFTLIKPYIF